MDITVLPNNNHPEKFLQLDVGMLPATHGMFQVGYIAGAALSGQRRWHNRVYSKKLVMTQTHNGFEYSVLQKHITPVTLKPKIKTNPLYSDIQPIDIEDNQKSKPSWTIQEYDKHTIHGNLEDYLKEDPKDLSFWLEELYTPGYDSLLKKKEAELKRNKFCKIVTAVFLSICAIIIIITVPVIVTRNKT
uniref:Major intrinsically disordered Notch2-binding receptor 1-like C-terminal domain-containing protein n=1 Tax=Denticeps clupeoides TaxID=299321 RepID=A0AAY4B565_9TELE